MLWPDVVGIRLGAGAGKERLAGVGAASGDGGSPGAGWVWSGFTPGAGSEAGVRGVGLESGPVAFFRPALSAGGAPVSLSLPHVFAPAWSGSKNPTPIKTASVIANAKRSIELLFAPASCLWSLLLNCSLTRCSLL